MTSRIIPVLSIMSEIYACKKADRFPLYLHHLQGAAGSDLVLPISGYNPMAEIEVADVVNSLIEAEIENRLAAEILQLQQRVQLSSEIGFALNIVDDLGGAWSHKSVVDFKDKFQNQALLARSFAIVSVYTSEVITLPLIIERLSASYYRCRFQLDHGFPTKLIDHVKQETYVREQLSPSNELRHSWKQKDKNLISLYGQSVDYNLIFNYWYGNKVCDELGYPCPLGGFQ